MKPYKNRTIDPSKPVRAYRNLHEESFSVVQDGLVVAHTDQLCLRDARPYVSDAGRNRVIQTKRKEVHAWIEGYIDNAPAPTNQLLVKYNPYRFKRFCMGPEGSEQSLLYASHIWLTYPIVFVED